jgi:hypothetical protein
MPKTAIGLSALLLLTAAADPCVAQDAVSSARQFLQPSLACNGHAAEHMGCLDYRAPGDVEGPTARRAARTAQAAAAASPDASEASLADCGYVCVFAISTDEIGRDLTRLARSRGHSQQ